MIGAAAARRFAAGERAGLDLDARPSLPLATRAGEPGRRRRTPARLDPAAVRRTLKAAQPAGAPRALAELPDRRRRPRGILAEAAPAPGRRVLEVGPGLGILTGALLAAGAAVTAVELDRGLAACLRSRRSAAAARRTDRCGSWRATCSTRTWRRSCEPPFDVVANLPYHITSPVLHRLLELERPPGAAGPDGPARGRGTDRGAARRDELPVGLRPVPRRASGSRSRCRGPRSSRSRRSIRRSSCSSRRGAASPRLPSAGRGGRALAARPGRLPRAAQDAPQRARAPAAGRRRDASRRRSPPPGSTGDRRPQTLERRRVAAAAGRRWGRCRPTGAASDDGTRTA